MSRLTRQWLLAFLVVVDRRENFFVRAGRRGAARRLRGAASRGAAAAAAVPAAAPGRGDEDPDEILRNRNGGGSDDVPVASSDDAEVDSRSILRSPDFPSGFPQPGNFGATQNDEKSTKSFVDFTGICHLNRPISQNFKTKNPFHLKIHFNS